MISQSARAETGTVSREYDELLSHFHRLLFTVFRRGYWKSHVQPTPHVYPAVLDPERPGHQALAAFLRLSPSPAPLPLPSAPLSPVNECFSRGLLSKPASE